MSTYIERVNDLIVPVEGITIDYKYPYDSIPAVSVMQHDRLDDVYISFISKTPSSITFIFKKDGEPIERIVDFIASGDVKNLLFKRLRRLFKL